MSRSTSNTRPGIWAGNRGIATSLLEATLVVTIAAILSSVALLVAGDQVGEADINRARTEVKLIGVSILSFIQDTGHAPAYLAGNQTGPNDFTAALLQSEGADPFDATSTWPFQTAVRDPLFFQIVRNNPGQSNIAYARIGEIAHARFQGWNGPYMSKIPSADPWGGRYLVTIGFATSQGAAATGLPATRRPAVFVISAGANRSIETRYFQAADEFVEGGDDFIFRIQ